jgi:hypothetical protein
VAWLRVNPRVLQQGDPRHRRLLYWDEGPYDTGQLFVWVDGAGDVARFQLSHRRFLTYAAISLVLGADSDLPN